MKMNAHIHQHKMKHITRCAKLRKTDKF